MYFVENEVQSGGDDWQIANVVDYSDIRDWDAAVDQIPRCFILKTPLNCHCQLVLHSFRDIKPMQFIIIIVIIIIIIIMQKTRLALIELDRNGLQRSAHVEVCQICTAVIRQTQHCSNPRAT